MSTTMDCKHNQRCRYTDGYYCEDCQTWFGEDSPTYRRTELLSTLWMVCHNIDADVQQRTYGTDSFHGVPEARAMADKIGIGVNHDHDYEALIAEAEAFAAKYGRDKRSAEVAIG